MTKPDDLLQFIDGIYLGDRYGPCRILLRYEMSPEARDKLWNKPLRPDRISWVAPMPGEHEFENVEVDVDGVLVRATLLCIGISPERLIAIIRTLQEDVYLFSDREQMLSEQDLAPFAQAIEDEFRRI